MLGEGGFFFCTQERCDEMRMGTYVGRALDHAGDDAAVRLDGGVGADDRGGGLDNTGG